MPVKMEAEYTALTKIGYLTTAHLSQTPQKMAAEYTVMTTTATQRLLTALSVLTPISKNNVFDF